MTRKCVAALLLLLTACPHAQRVDEPPPRVAAQKLIDGGEPQKAIPVLERLQRDAPEDLELARLLAEAQVKAGRSGAFLETLGKARPTAATHFMRGLVLFAQAADATPDAVQELEAAIALSPRQPELHFRLGLMFLESEKYERALAPLQRASELSPNRAGYYLPLAKAYSRNGDPKAAVETLRRMVDSGPTPQQVEIARALMNELSDPFGKVPKAVQGKLEEGISWLQTHDVPQQAMVQFEEILRDYPDLAAVHALLGLAYQRLDDAGRAVDEFRRAIELAPDNGRFHLYLAQVYLARRRPEQARVELEKSIELDPLLDEAYHRLGDLAFERRDLDTAERLFATLVTLTPDSPAARGKLARLLELKGDYAGAERNLRAVLERDPQNLEFMLRLGLLDVERARAAKSKPERDRAKAEAEEWIRKVLDRAPENADASEALETLRKL